MSCFLGSDLFTGFIPEIEQKQVEMEQEEPIMRFDENVQDIQVKLKRI